LVAQVPSFVDGPTFGGSKLFSEGLIPEGSGIHSTPHRGFFALGFSRGEQGADKFMTYLDDISSGDLNKINKAILELVESPWGLRARAYGLALHNHGTTISLTREEMTSLWTNVLDSETVGFDVRSSMVDRFSITYSSQGNIYYGSTLRIERWSLGHTYQELGVFSRDWNLRQAKSLLDYGETQNRCLT
jgi:hypothetical protein